ncbi:DNA cytosine methyltransferase [Micromonospora sediminicola]|uniref:DNA cytosine methyltransferase n=1 Tax=Micromonospora sediminicola TaxID=946078 RepID=UPI00339F8C0A
MPWGARPQWAIIVVRHGHGRIRPVTNTCVAPIRAGITGEHSSLWSAVADAVRVLRPPLVFVENVAALLRRGFDVVQSDLAAIGYDTSWTCLRASDIGAAHRRDRLFLLAAPTGRLGGGADAADTVRP